MEQARFQFRRKKIINECLYFATLYGYERHGAHRSLDVSTIGSDRFAICLGGWATSSSFRGLCRRAHKFYPQYEEFQPLTKHGSKSVKIFLNPFNNEVAGRFQPRSAAFPAQGDQTEMFGLPTTRQQLRSFLSADDSKSYPGISRPNIPNMIFPRRSYRIEAGIKTQRLGSQ